MTPTTGTTGATGTIRHPDVSEISDLAEGLLSPSRTSEVRRHLGECALCADVRASLEEIRSLLGTLPGPPRMPVDIAGRIDAALAAEALLDSRPPAPQPPSAPTHRATPDVSRETSPAARAPEGHPAGSTGPGRRRARRRIAVLTGLAGAAACALGVFLFTGLQGSPSQDASARKDAASTLAQPKASGEYSAQNLRSTVQQLLTEGNATAQSTQREQSPGLQNTSPDGAVAPQDRRAADSVPRCVLDGTGRPDAPLASGQGSYQGSPVYLVVLPHPGDAGRVDAYLIGSGCADTPGADPGKVLLTSTYPRR
ncbi:hypothetical protein OHS33_18280 [Streptomyces sp. NBC_00536]|uniref:hypothetical protein n=1 Tax=Streptomyces sp. NBC_00536 TaxID=2975769 RepID=UPI002E816E2C|nr:hypothetical protein [Streptomyces sp. NBC_00536]WUC80120.1 hypothetical protein OHS33_18280 [Streptomyces sp. NBC_00536]